MARKIPIITALVNQGFNITWYRSLNDWSQEDLERESGVSQQDISKYEKLNNKIPEEALQKFAAAFRVDIMYLRDVASYTAAENNIVIFNDDSQQYKDQSKKVIHPLEMFKETYDENVTRIIEAHNKNELNLQAQIADLKKDKEKLQEEKADLTEILKAKASS